MRKTALCFLAAAFFVCAQAEVRAEDGTPLLKGGVSMDDSEYDVKMAAIDSAERGLELAHENKVKAIEEQDSDTKEIQIADENQKFENQKKDLERRRALLEKRGDLGQGDIPGRLMKLAREMDRVATRMQNSALKAGNEFVGGMSDSVSRTAKFLAQKPGAVVPQMADAIVTYLTTDYNENNQRLYDEAVKAADEIQKNPARFFGEHAIDAAATAAGGAMEMAEARAAATAAEMAAAEKAGMGRLQQMRRKQAKKLEEAGQTLEGMAGDAEKFGGFAGGETGSAVPDFKKLFPGEPGAAGPVNIIKSIDKKSGFENCFPVAMAAAKRWKTGKPYVALDHNPHVPLYDPSKGKFVYGDVGTRNGKIMEILKRNYGGGKAKNPFHGGLKGLKSHQEGIPVESSQKKIESALRIAGDRSQGLVFVDGGKGTGGHVFNVRNNNGKIEFWDFQADPPVQYMSFRDGSVVMKANGKMANVPLPWKRVFFYRLD